jgi:hypothetical protein
MSEALAKPSEMVEKVADAIENADDVDGQDLAMREVIAPWVTPEMRRSLMRIAARAAIEAMRLVTDDMISAAEDANADYRTTNLNPNAHLGPEGVFVTMLDAALSTGERG